MAIAVATHDERMCGSYSTAMPFAYPARTIKRLRVVVDEAGTVDAFHPALYPSEDWWDALLEDPRARQPRDDSGGWRGPRTPALRGHTLHIGCEKCPVRMTRDGDMLAAINSPDVPVATIVTLLIGCTKSAKRCRRTFDLIPKGPSKAAPS